MDVFEFTKERIRMCKSYKDCKGCPLYDNSCGIDSIISDEDCKRSIAAVEQWSKEHPRKTRQSVFLKQYPKAKLDKDGVLHICPAFMGGKIPEKYRCICSTDCGACRREFWMQKIGD